MMTDPSVKDLMEKMHEGDSRYTLVIATAKRARQLTNGYTAFATAESGKPVSVAAKEIKDGSIVYFKEEKNANQIADFADDALDITEMSLFDDENAEKGLENEIEE